MKPPSLDEFYNRLYETQSYETPAGPPPRVADRLLGRFDWWHHLRFLKIIISGSIDAYRGRFTPEAWAWRAYRVLSLIEGCGGRISVSGLRPAFLEGSKPMVYVGNHMSIVETMLVPLLLMRANHITPVIKSSLLKYPGFAEILRSLRAISVERKNPRDDLKAVLSQGTERLKEGRSVLIFPQSTRTTFFDPEKFNSLGVKLAKRAGTAVVPIAIKTDFHGTGKKLKDFGPIDRSKRLRFGFGPIMDPTDSKATHQKIVEFISANLTAWQKEELKK